MRALRRLHAVAAASALLLGACADATRPRGDPQAAHYDNLAAAAFARGDILRGGALSTVALAYYHGIMPATVTVQDSGTTTVYRAAVVRTVLNGGFPFPPGEAWPDLWDIVLWQEPDGDRFILISGHTDSVSFAPDPGGSLLHFGQVDWGAAGREKQGVGGYTLLAEGAPSGSCAPESATATCTRATFLVSIAAVLKPLLVPGGRLVDNSGPPHPIEATSLAVPGVTQ
jgi:hypothetical protein